MPKYIAILSSDKQIPDDEFRAQVLDVLENVESHGLSGFVLIEAMNLEGLREELWKRKELLKEDSRFDDSIDRNLIVEESFESIKDLFQM